MKKSKSRWLKGCGIGCGVAIRETLVERHGSVNDFTPRADGEIPADRMDAFLQVRRAVQEHCAEIGATDAGIEAMDRLDDQEKPGNMAILGAFREASKAVFGMGTVMGEFFRARNAALLELDMSLGEYSYIYALAYGVTIVGPQTDEQAAIGDAHLSTRVRETLRLQLRNRLAAMDLQPEEWEGTEERRLLVGEIAFLEDHPERLPWCDVRPPSLQASLAAYETQLAELYCPDATHLELTRNRSFGIGIQGD